MAVYLLCCKEIEGKHVGRNLGPYRPSQVRDLLEQLRAKPVYDRPDLVAICEQRPNMADVKEVLERTKNPKTALSLLPVVRTIVDCKQ